MRIDAHQHFWQYDAEKHAWIDDGMKAIQRDFLPTDLKPLLDKEGIDGTVVVQADESLAENTFLLGLAEQHPWIKKVVGWVDLCSDEVLTTLERYAQEPKMTGFRMILQGQPPELMAEKSFRNGLGQLQKFDFTYDILIFPHHMDEAIELVSQFPNQPFVIDHLAKPYIKDRKIDEWAGKMKQLAERENVCCKASGMVTEADWNRWTREDLRPYLDVVFEAFGPKRLMFGSDWPVAQVAADYPVNVSVVNAYIHQLSQHEQADIMGNTAASFYGIQ
ncbi:amidohydrolase family protein [Echinicola vietnamensis]|uniref:Putative TIM-barrel fold metal-dependent hydrolase n=1 Tax=Echinicola vietnamensis (strain DSM 17526 / LMG 23754 / KMM 6221) TaxID=926556 RepID=L0G2F6_ECHVK|nr:amidohydrolase family protein [Echinicola vietnamensis]AGA79176.1 putative TIM-barrel fold metal-dependent hydrolase [Echinicola vietnamensis DSM 17526]